jgi:Ca-activated chloride channel homolog
MPEKLTQKTQIMRTAFNRRILLLLIILAPALFLLDGCKKKSDEPSSPTPYSNMNDNTTTAIQVSIPRIQLSKTKSTMITIFLSVTDQDGNPFHDFNQYNFTVKQVCDGTKDTAVIASITFTRADLEGYDIASGLVMDYSGSMAGKAKKDMEKAAKQFIRLKKNTDYAEIIKFDDEIHVFQPYTQDTTALVYAIDSAYGGGATAFYDATDAGITDAAAFSHANYGFLPSVIAFTDGQDNKSKTADLLSCIARANSEQLPVYTIGYRNSVDSASLISLATQSGGRYFFTPDSEELSEIFTRISGQLKSEYMLSWPFDDPTCQKVWVFVTATYTCANGTFTAKTERYFFPVKK